MLHETIDSDFKSREGIYSPHLDQSSAVIKIPTRAGHMIPHQVRDIRADPDGYLDSYVIVSLLWKELYTH